MAQNLPHLLGAKRSPMRSPMTPQIAGRLGVLACGVFAHLVGTSSLISTQRSCGSVVQDRVVSFAELRCGEEYLSRALGVERRL